jgi:hypothetical protein
VLQNNLFLFFVTISTKEIHTDTKPNATDSVETDKKMYFKKDADSRQNKTMYLLLRSIYKKY